MKVDKRQPSSHVAYVHHVALDQCSAGLRRLVDLLGGVERFVQSGSRVFIKPNLVAPFYNAVTSYALLSEVIALVRDAGGKPLVGESSGFEFDTAHTFKALGLHDFAAARDVPVLNLDNEDFVPVTVENGPVRTLWIARAAMEADVLINLPRLKRHSLTRVTVGMKNLFGLLRRDSRRRLHARGIEAGIVALNRAIRPNLTIVDGLTVLSRAVYGRSEPSGILVGSADLRALDPFCAGLLGVDFKMVPHISQFAGHDPQYQIVGDTPARREHMDNHGTMPERIYRLIFRGIYLADSAYAALRPGHSLVPTVHYWLGIRPAIRSRECTECGDCAEICPVDAIDVSARRIISGRCMSLRCLRCVKVCPENAIEVKGWRRPD
jgi:uncharacterized protein (DUF362 family)/NAD-dependent dihydropyrimidine dehydrogenase PreA subunit